MANHCKLLLIVTRYRVLNITLLGCRRLITILPVRAIKKKNQIPAFLPNYPSTNQPKVQVIHVFLFDKQWKILMHITIFKVQEAKPQNDSFRITNFNCLVFWLVSLGSFLTTYDLLLITL